MSDERERILYVHVLEPMTVATDYALGVLGVWLGIRLWRRSSREEESVRLWAGTLFAMALAAFAGGTAHGFADRLGESGHWIVWRITVWSIGVASLCIVAAMARFAFSRRTAANVIAVFALQFVLYAVWMLWHDGFQYVILDYVPAMLFVLATALWLGASRGWAGSRWVAAGILVSFAAAGIQVSGLALHRHFNHNDLYHLIQMAGVYLLYRGGRHLVRVPVEAEAGT